MFRIKNLNSVLIIFIPKSRDALYITQKNSVEDIQKIFKKTNKNLYRQKNIGIIKQYRKLLALYKYIKKLVFI